MILHIKNMVCVRCKMAVESVLQELGIPYTSVELGRAQLAAPLSLQQQAAVVKGLAHFQLELMEDRTRILMERIKTEIITLLQAPQPLQLKLSVHLSQLLNYNYTYLANLFSDQEGMTLEKYFITQRTERVKELLLYEDLTLTEIADELLYSNVSHLCQQFKKVTGLTPAEFKKCCASDDFVWRAV